MCNLGTTDKIIRIVIGSAIIIAGYYYNSWLGLIGLIPLITAAISFCPLYYPFGIKTCKCDTGDKKCC